MLDVLTSLSDCRHETVERIMERRISGGLYMCWMDFHNAICVLCCGFLYAQLISFYFTSTTPRATTPHLYITGYHAEGYHAPSIPHGLPRLYHHCTAITPVYISRLPLQGLPLPIFTTTCYHTRHSSSYFLVYLSPAFTPPVLLAYTTTGAPHATTYSTR